MSIGVKVILLVEGDIVGEYLHPYTELGTLKVNTNMCTMDKLTKRWTFTSPKIDKPFGARFHFENFWEPMSIGVKVILLAGHDNTLYIPCWMFTRLAFTRALTGADDHARFILPKEVERVLDHRGSTCTPPSISTGVKGEGWILVFHVLDIKGFVVEPVPSPAPPESGFDPKVQ
uniref:Uncharacterized protein n=1 Tax=Fagus sylvatica TaxID=28930 RepID=A0A2N9G752_FAGSY